MIPEHWQKQIEKIVTSGVEIVTLSRFDRGIRMPDVVWVYHPISVNPVVPTLALLEGHMAFLAKTLETHRAVCSWKFKVNFVDPEFYFQKHFIRVLGAATYITNPKLQRLVQNESGLNGDAEAELFFVDTFYKMWLYNPERLTRDRYVDAVAHFERIDQKAKSLFN